MKPSDPKSTKKLIDHPWPPVPPDVIVRQSGSKPRGHWLWPSNLLDAVAGWYDKRSQARYARKGY